MNVAVFVAAALLLDVVLWLFVVIGWESVAVPADFAITHQPEFGFPYSHGLLASLLWSAVAGATALAWGPGLAGTRYRIGALVSLAVFSHWLLDALVHRPEMPLGGAASPKIGLGLWQNMPVALASEATIVVVGLWMFCAGGRLSRGKTAALAVLTMVVLVFTALGMTVAPPPPSPLAMAMSSLVTIAGVCGLMAWFGGWRAGLRAAHRPARPSAR